MNNSDKILSFLLITLLLVNSCINRTSPDQQKQIPSNGEKDGAKIEFQSEMHNFGTLKAGETVSYSFIFKNNGKQTV